MQIPPNKIRYHKRHFQLLELMVAVFILLVCIAPAMRIYTTMYQSQQAIIRENQRDHLAHTMHAKFTELLYQQKVPLKQMMSGESSVLGIGDTELNEMRQTSAYGYDVSGTFTILDCSPLDREKTNKYKGKIVIQMKDKLYKPPKSEENQCHKNGDPSITEYDYIVYIDSGAKDKEKREGNDNPNPSETESALSGTADDDGDDDGDDDDNDDDEDDDDDDEDEDDDDDDDDEDEEIDGRRSPTQLKPSSTQLRGMKR